MTYRNTIWVFSSVGLAKEERAPRRASRRAGSFRFVMVARWTGFVLGAGEGERTVAKGVHISRGDGEIEPPSKSAWALTLSRLMSGILCNSNST